VQEQLRLVSRRPHEAQRAGVRVESSRFVTPSRTIRPDATDVETSVSDCPSVKCIIAPQA